MNCAEFADNLFEYLDASLSRAGQAAAREHLENCDRCRMLLARHVGVSRLMRQSFAAQTQQLFLRPARRRSVLNATPPPPMRPLAALWRVLILGGMVLGCVVLLIAAMLRHRASSLAANICVIDVPIQTTMRVHRKEHGVIVDAVLPVVALIHASYSENSKTK